MLEKMMAVISEMSCRSQDCPTVKKPLTTDKLAQLSDRTNL